MVASNLTVLEARVHSLKTARRITLGLLEGIAPADWFHQPVAGGQHVMWIVGHLTVADDWGLVSLGRERRLAGLSDSFGRTISSDPSRYPTIDEARRLLGIAHDALIERLNEIRQEDLRRSTSGPIAEFAPNLDTLLASHVWHEGFHGGQLALIRRSLGLPVRWG